MDSFQEFIETHPLTKDEVKVMYDFLYALWIMDNKEHAGRGRSVAEVMDILVEFYE